MAFANIFCWQHRYHTQIAEYGGFLLVRFTTEQGKLGYMQPIGEGSKEEIIEVLATDAAQSGEPLRLFGLDKEWCDTVKQTPTISVATSSLAANADYIYLSADLAELPGRKYQPKRNYINRFTSRYNYRFQRLSADKLDDCRKLNNEWCEQKGTMCDIDEQRAVACALDNFSLLPLEGWIIYVDDRPAAFAIGSAVNHDTFCIHIEKVMTEYEGIGAMINNLVATELQQRFKYINREDDLGIEGLRRAKQSYYPVKLLTKHSVLQLSQHEVEMQELWTEVFGDEKSEIDHFFVQLYNPAQTFVHKVDNRVVAMLYVVPIPQKEKTAAYIYAVATTPHYRNQGIASILLRNAVESIQKAGIYDRIILIPADDRAKQFYNKFGFTETDELLNQSELGIEYNLGTGEESADFVMERKIY